MERLTENLEECPFCRSGNVSYEALELDEESVYYPVTCDKCGKEYKEYYNLVFDGNYGDGE